MGRGDASRAEALEYVLAYTDRFNDPKQYGNVIIRANPDGELLRLKDVATVALGSEYYDIYSNMNGYPSAAIMLKQTYGSDAGKVIANVKTKLEELKKTFPPGMDYEISYDVSKFLDASDRECNSYPARCFYISSVGGLYIFGRLALYAYSNACCSGIPGRGLFHSCSFSGLPST